MTVKTKQEQLAEVITDVRKYEERLAYWKLRSLVILEDGSDNEHAMTTMRLCQSVLARKAIELADILEDKQ